MIVPRYISRLPACLGIAAAAFFSDCSALAQPVLPMPPTLKISVVQGATSKVYTVYWSTNMTVLNALEQALPTVPASGAFSLKYFPQYSGYQISTVGGIPASGTSGYWTTCLQPAAAGSTVIMLPLAPDRILVGVNDIVGLIYNGPCPTSLPVR